MDKCNIEQKVRALHKAIWQEKEQLWRGYQPKPIQMLQPEAAARVLGIDYQEVPNLGDTRFARKGTGYRIAGCMDRQAQVIAVSQEFKPEVMKFTAAHELGHWVMHPKNIMHRDLPIDGPSLKNAFRSQEEKEADYFAACYLMPAKLVIEEFEARFGPISKFRFNEHTCFHLGLPDHNRALRCEEDSLDREFLLVRSTRYDGRYFNSLAKAFGVSDQAMAIRLKELKLLRWP